MIQKGLSYLQIHSRMILEIDPFSRARVYPILSSLDGGSGGSLIRKARRLTPHPLHHLYGG